MSISYEIQPRSLRHVLPAPAVASTGWDTPWVQSVVLVCWSLSLFLYGIHQGDLYRTEGLRAIIGQEMYRSGDWLVPRLYGAPILTKPPMFYWAIAATGYLFGEVTTWSARLPAAVAGLLAVLIVYGTMRRYYGSRIGFLAALALPVSFMWLEKASSSEIDTMLVMWVLAAWACFLRLMEQLLQEERTSLLWWLAALLCVAGGVMTKWTGFLFFYVMAIPMLLWYRQAWRLLHWQHLLAACLGVVLVWCWLGLVVGELGWTTVINMLWVEGAPRVIHGKSASQHLIVETLLHPLKVMGICLPWSVFALMAWWQRRTGSATTSTLQQVVSRSLLCWAVLGTLMMTVFPDHNIRQSFSLVPAWTLLGALAIRQWFLEQRLPAWIRHKPMHAISIAVAVWLIVKIAYVQVLVPARFLERPSLREQASRIQNMVPREATLYLSRVKDECLMFNYGRAVRRLGSWEQLNSATPAFCLLTSAERASWLPGLVQLIVQEDTLLDAQGEQLTMVQLAAKP